jgi:hypothetical protein
MKEDRRSIRTQFWNDPEIENLSERATYLFSSLLTFPENNIAGVFEITEKKISHYTKMSLEDIQSAFRELEIKNKVRRFGYWVIIKNHIKNQKINANMSISIVKDLCKTPNNALHWLYYKSDSERLESWIRNMVYNLNEYFEQQRRRLVKSALELPSKTQPSKSQMEEYESTYPCITISESNFIALTTESLPTHIDEISNYFNFLTITKSLPYPILNEEDRSMKGEDRKVKGEGRKVKGEDRSLNSGSKSGDISPEQFSNSDDAFSDYPETGHPDSFDNLESKSDEQHFPWTASALDEIRKFSNSLTILAPERKAPMNWSDYHEIIKSVRVYSQDEVSKAIQNHEQLCTDPEAYDVVPFKTLSSFLKNGIAKYCDDNKPFEKFGKFQLRNKKADTLKNSLTGYFISSKVLA